MSQFDCTTFNSVDCLNSDSVGAQSGFSDAVTV